MSVGKKKNRASTVMSEVPSKLRHILPLMERKVFIWFDVCSLTCVHKGILNVAAVTRLTEVLMSLQDFIKGFVLTLPDI